jgi:hypothetical protein
VATKTPNWIPPHNAVESITDRILLFLFVFWGNEKKTCVRSERHDFFLLLSFSFPFPSPESTKTLPGKWKSTTTTTTTATATASFSILFFFSSSMVLVFRKAEPKTGVMIEGRKGKATAS